MTTRIHHPVPALIAAAVVLSLGCAPRGGVESAAAAAPAMAPVSPAFSPGDPHIGLQRDPRLAELLVDISPQRLRRIDSTLVSFGTRHSMSDTLSPTRGIGAARRWIHAELSRYSAACNGCLDVSYDEGMVEIARYEGRPVVNIVNVLATLPGRDRRRVIVVGGHYDSCICSIDGRDFTSDAPGANDDGSGTSAVIELARVFAERFPRGFDATVVFAAFAGEENGLLGSRNLAERLRREGYTVSAAITNDIIGNVVGEDGRVDSMSVRLFADGPDNGPSRELLRYAWASGVAYQPSFEIVPVFRLDRLGRGGDHRPFHELNWPGLRFTERVENYRRQHLPADDLANVSFPYVARVARVNAATIGALAMAPPPPDSGRFRRDRDSGGQKFQLSWAASPGATGYEVMVRRTIAPTWERVIPVGNATTYLLDAQLDDVWAGVRAMSAAGHRSLVASIPAPIVPRTLQ
ncbi:MAG TPA: M28 family peptidase [Gemmatimonadaceae bacterium]|nr:M28 family peptidase [Gemmatimonadaceae bacterium]